MVMETEEHTGWGITVSDLSDRGVRTSIRYGTSADSCTKTSAPNYTQAGYYTVYYEIDYSVTSSKTTHSVIYHNITKGNNTCI